jgi:tetratricopeptide (TPR) repeat protein
MRQQVQGDTRRLTMLRSGIERAQAGDLEGGAAEFSTILAENSRDAEALNNLAIVYRRQNKLQDALGSALDAIDIDPTKTEYQYNLGKIYRDLGNFKSAAMAYAKAVEEAPDLIPAYINLGASHYLLHEWNKAELFFRMGLSHDPEHPVLKNSHAAAQIAKETNGDEAPGAIEEADDLFVDFSPSDPAPSTGTENLNPPADPAALPDPPAAETEKTARQLLSLEKIKGLLHYLQSFSAFMPPRAVQLLGENEVDAGISRVIAALEEIERGTAAGTEDDSNRIAADSGGSPGNGNAEPAAADSDENAGFPHITAILNHLEKLADFLPETEERNRLTGQVHSIIKELQEAANKHDG